MLKTDMQRIVEIVCRRARRQGFVSPQEVRDALARAGLPEAQWVEVVSLAGDMLSNHDGCLYYSGPAAEISPEQRRQRQLIRAVRRLIHGYKASVQEERRRQGRFDFVHPVHVQTEDGRTFTLLSCDLSVSGIRIVAPFSLLGKKIRVTLPDTHGAVYRCFNVQVVWSSLIGEGLYENGATFIGVANFTTTDAAPLSAPPLPAASPGSVPPPIAQGQMPLQVGGPGHPRPR